ncbi:hypothetical protein TSUKUMMB_55730 [Rhodococcus sp. no. 34]
MGVSEKARLPAIREQGRNLIQNQTLLSEIDERPRERTDDCVNAFYSSGFQQGDQITGVAPNRLDAWPRPTQMPHQFTINLDRDMTAAPRYS